MGWGTSPPWAEFAPIQVYSQSGIKRSSFILSCNDCNGIWYIQEGYRSAWAAICCVLKCVMECHSRNNTSLLKSVVLLIYDNESGTWSRWYTSRYLIIKDLERGQWCKITTCIVALSKHKRLEQLRCEFDRGWNDPWITGHLVISLSNFVDVDLSRGRGTALSNNCNARHWVWRSIRTTDLYKPLIPSHIRFLRIDGIIHIDEPDLGYSGEVLVGGLRSIQHFS